MDSIDSGIKLLERKEGEKTLTLYQRSMSLNISKDGKCIHINQCLDPEVIWGSPFVVVEWWRHSQQTGPLSKPE